MMDNYNKLTEAARAALDNSVEDIKEMILDKAYQNATLQHSCAEISLQDILKATQEILNKGNNVTFRENKKRRMGIICALAGFVYALCGIFLYIYQNYTINIEQDLGLIIASVGSIVSLTGVIIVQFVSNKTKDYTGLSRYNILEFELINKWKTIENLAAILMRKDRNSSKAATNIHSIIEYIGNNLSTNIEQTKLKDLIVVRNSVVHNSSHISREQILENILTADEIILLLENKIHPYRKHL